MVKDIERFIAGFRAFREDYFGAGGSRFDALKNSQRPRTMIIGCSDSRVDPAMLTGAGPGDIFIVRNVANLVPPCEDGGGHHGVSAALEFAVCQLEVEHIVVLGHSGCGGINALMAGARGENYMGFLTKWMDIASAARDLVLSDLPGKSPELQRRAVEMASILLSLENLHTFPFITAKMAVGRLSLHGWYFDLHAGELLEYHAPSSVFERIDQR
ncbi:Carbonic anhydrase [Dehalogenimonas alkenigignens]|uniref:Carbonic anhydrase n=1 Tax=Dehalogenimonas alkenigignens TaxID=1217799 RepID=A0A0W0GG29_9CHLR|nr:Carbonic anhydrase [Dehalogenimonas alkenigignens]